MHSEEEFKKGLEDILASKDIPFNEADWENAREMLDSRKRRRKLAYFILPLGLLLIPALMFVFTSEENKATQNTSVSSYTPANNTAIAPTKKVSQAPAPSGESTRQHRATPVAATEKPDETIHKPKTNAGPKPIDKAPDATPVHVKPPKSESSPVIAITKASPEPLLNPMSSTLPRIESEPSSQKTNTATNEKNTTVAPVTEPATEITTLLPQQEVPANATITSAPTVNFTETVSTLSEPMPAASATPILQNQNAEPQQPAMSPDTAAVAATTATPNQQSSFPDTASMPPYLKHPVPETMLVAELGGNYAFGWKDGGKRDGAGFNLLAGIYYSSPVTRHFSLAYGLQYFSQGNMALNSRTAKVTRYKLAEESDVTVITPKRADYLAIPVKLGYHLNRNNLFGMSYTGAYLINVESNVETFHQGMRGKENQELSRTSGYTEGFNTFVSKIGVFYRRRLAYKWWLNAEAEYGISDLKNDTFFNLKVKEHASGIKVSLIYNFWMIK